jgi:starch synthase
MKAGGLADVVASLPRALRRHGHEVEVYIPNYGAIESHHLRGAESAGTVELNVPSLPKRAEILRVVSRDVPVHLVSCTELFEKEPLPYGHYSDDVKRWAFFSLAVLEAMKRPGKTPDVIHLHDWPTGLFPVYRALRYKDTPLGNVGILFTVHNLSFAGKFHKDWIPQLGLPAWLFDREQLEFHGECSLVKAGLLWSTMIGTVSPNYAREIQGEALGCGLDGVLRRRSYDLVGVLNGIDTQVWDPARAETDPAGGDWVPFTEDQLSKRESHRGALRKRFGLVDRESQGKGLSPIFGFVGALSPQHGLTALFEVIPKILAAGGQLAILGDGAEAYEDTLREIGEAHRGQIGVALEFNPVLAKRIYAGSDFFLRPSKFDPCGLSQMIACRYGSIPIVAHTGGLADTIRDVDADSQGNGLTFATPATMVDKEWHPAAAKGLAKAVERALAIHADRPRFDEIRRRAMRCDFSWERSARKYEDVYADTIRREGGVAEHYGP